MKYWEKKLKNELKICDYDTRRTKTDIKKQIKIVSVLKQSTKLLYEKDRAIMNTIKINECILNYINNHKPPFEFIPKLGSLWKIEQEISYPNVNGGYPVIELSNSKGEWLRLPKCIINNEYWAIRL